MRPGLLLLWVLAYLGLLLAVAAWTSRRADDAAFYVGSRSSPWSLVAFGMIGTSLSGVTFVSVPGAVGLTQFSYLQVVIGQVLGYAVVALVLLPQFHRRGLVSIYGYLGQRLGPAAQRTGAAIFVVSRTLGATARLYLVVRVLQDMILDAYGVPFWLSAALVLLMILLYTLQGGVRTIVYTDTLQTGAMLIGLAVCTALLLQHLGLSLPQGLAALHAAGLSRIWRTDPMAADYFGKQLVAGLFIAIAMTGLDQEMMQKSLSVRRLAGAQANLLVLGLVMVGVVALFLVLGGLLVLAAPAAGVHATGDRLFPAVVLRLLPAWVQVLFVIALVSALLPSADGALTALTASTCIDLLHLPARRHLTEAARTRIRHRVHAGYALLFMALLLGFRALDDPSMIGLILKLAAYTYGPLLGLFAFALVSRRRPRPAWVPVVVIAAPLLCWVLDAQQARLLGPWRVGLELLVLNGALTAAGLRLVSRPPAG
ncbi:MAG: sodium:solute symporter [Burkholderiales bacterium]|nr:sodium:solute symporter [Burkholderiales bacterium]